MQIAVRRKVMGFDRHHGSHAVVCYGGNLNAQKVG